MGGNVGTNDEINWGAEPPPEDYLGFLNRINANWVGIVVDLNAYSSLDPTVRRIYEGHPSSFTDEALTVIIDTLHRHGCNVYLTLAFEPHEGDDSEHPTNRNQFGEPDLPLEDPRILPENWLWSVDHPDHEAFVADFFRTYTDQAVHIAQLAEDLGVEMYSLGTETDRLFRTRSGGRWPNDFVDELRSMIESVRAVYSGLLTYDMHTTALVVPEYLGPGSDHLWEDLGLDVVGISARFRLDYSLDTLPSVGQYEENWERIFSDYLIPLRQRNPNLPILFLEFGYGGGGGFRVFMDEDGNGLNDREEAYANLLNAFYNVNERFGRLVAGEFLWAHHWSSDRVWAASTNLTYNPAVRDELAEYVVRDYYLSQLD